VGTVAGASVYREPAAAGAGAAATERAQTARA